MKKKYVAPRASSVALFAEAPLAASTWGLNNGNADQWSNERAGGWNSDDWSGVDDSSEE